jgi:large subunit ribosomal protein L1
MTYQKSSASKKKDAPITEPQNDQTAELSDAELLKQKKIEAKEKKSAEKAEKKATKVTRKKVVSTKIDQKKIVQKRNPLKIHSKKWRVAREKIDPKNFYSLEDAVKLVCETASTKFDSSVEVHTRLNINPKKSDQIVRATVSLPNGSGKKLRIIVFVAPEKIAEAKKAGAIEAGEDDLIEKIKKGWLDFDVAVATPEVMKKLGKIAKTLGQKGLMPNPKAGTVTPNFVKAIKEIQKGRVEFRNDAAGILHNAVGKVSFEQAKLVENLNTYFKAVSEAKPKAVKGALITGIALASSMGPGVRVKL